MIKQWTQPTAAQGRLNAGRGLRAVTALFLCGMALFYACYSQPAMQVLYQGRELPIYCVRRDDKVISISFDAAWGGDQTMRILDILDEYNVKTTFFLVDIWTQRFPELVKEIDARGHEIGNHSTTHAQMSKQSREQIIRELSVMSDNIESLVGKRPTLFRPPYGDYNNRVVTTARQSGYEVIQWSVDSLDWKNYGAKDLIAKSTKNIQPGDIVLFHNDSRYILDALPEILRFYKEAGYEIIPVSDILLKGDTHINTQGRQVPAAKKE